MLGWSAAWEKRGQTGKLKNFETLPTPVGDEAGKPTGGRFSFDNLSLYLFELNHRIAHQSARLQAIKKVS